ncbi:hypothetical protein TNCV_1633211 [Trichonephila clavipes]|nr:hypothetical protein TNCV_1633211 [Trichonephila clavipes]
MQAQNVCDVRRITIRRDGQVLNTKAPHPDLNTPDLPLRQLNGSTSDAQSDHTSRIRCDAFSARDLDYSKTAIIHRFLDSCPTWLLEKEITALKIKNKISYPEARRVVSSRTPASGKAMRRRSANLYVSTAIQVDASTAPTSATAASITPKECCSGIHLESVSPPRDVKKNRKTRIKDSGCNPTKKRGRTL